MFASKLQIRLPRRITAYFLFFGIASLAWLCAGSIYVAHSVTESRSESAALRSLGHACDRFTLAYLRDQNADPQPVLAEIRLHSGADYCAVVSPSGDYLGHSTTGLRGKPAPEEGNVTARWGEITELQIPGDHGLLIHEYQAPLRVGGNSIGTLRMGFAQSNLWSYVSAGAEFAPLALLGPAFCMAVGSVLVSRLVRPVADIEQQLFQVATSPSVEGCELREVQGIGAAAVGWNRVIQQRLNAGQTETLQQRIRKSMEKSHHGRLDAVLNSISDGVATTDAEGRLTYTNLPMSVLLAISNVEHRSDGVGAAENAPIMIEQLKTRWQLSEQDPLLSEENRDRSVVTELTREENGQYRVARVARHPICSSGGTGSHECHVWTVRDVTQQKLAEEMRDQFVDTATHELRTPLANIKAYAETLALADVIDIEQQKQFLNTINSEATRLARFVDDLLSVSSMELGSLSLNKQVTELGRMLNDVLAKVRPQVEEKHLSLEVTLPEKLPEPELDKDKIATVLVNLLGNAVKYTPENGRVIFRVNMTDQQIEISVEDTGVGIAEDELGKVFDKFYRSNDPRVQAQTGTGLGLALSQEVVRLHGGRITVESEIDKGSTFTVTLPMS
ncbi:MAG TPA: ATP-binding protein [Lacipirellulaceae bacterium]|nr:ATP-binding protein [Lacipirellulaceae bacterium]